MEGRAPENLFSWRERVVSSDKALRSDGRVPERDCLARLMAVTRPVESHFTPFHGEHGTPEDHPAGGGLIDAFSRVITSASSAAARESRKIGTARRESRVLRCGFFIMFREREGMK